MLQQSLSKARHLEKSDSEILIQCIPSSPLTNLLCATLRARKLWVHFPTNWFLGDFGTVCASGMRVTPTAILSRESTEAFILVAIRLQFSQHGDGWPQKISNYPQVHCVKPIIGPESRFLALFMQQVFCKGWWFRKWILSELSRNPTWPSGFQLFKRNIRLTTSTQMANASRITVNPQALLYGVERPSKWARFM